MEKKVEDISTKHDNLKNELDSHKLQAIEEIGGLKEITSKKDTKIQETDLKVARLKSDLKPKVVRKGLLRWQIPAFFLALLGIIIIVFTILQFCLKGWTYNYSYQIITYIDNLSSETQKNTLHSLMYAPLLGLWLIVVYCWKRIVNSELKTEKKKQLETEFDEKYG